MYKQYVCGSICIV